MQIRPKFNELKNKWEQDTYSNCFVSDIINDSSYQQIILLGHNVVPLIIEELKNKPNWWFNALNKITGINPVPPNKNGHINEMTKCWISWWKDQ